MQHHDPIHEANIVDGLGKILNLITYKRLVLFAMGTSPHRSNQKLNGFRTMCNVFFMGISLTMVNITSYLKSINFQDHSFENFKRAFMSATNSAPDSAAISNFCREHFELLPKPARKRIRKLNLK